MTNVLLAEPDTAYARHLAGSLKSCHFRHIRNGSETFTEACEVKPDVIVTEWDFNGTDNSDGVINIENISHDPRTFTIPVFLHSVFDTEASASASNMEPTVDYLTVSKHTAIDIMGTLIDRAASLKTESRFDYPVLKRFFFECLSASPGLPRLRTEHETFPVQSEAGLVFQISQWQQILHRIRQRPEDILGLTPRVFEELVAHLLEKEGFDVQLTPQTRDGGRDILARGSNSLGPMLYLVECKRYEPKRHVGVNVVRGLYGVLNDEQATGAILVTTSALTRDAIHFIDRHRYQLSYKDFDRLLSWIRK